MAIDTIKLKAYIDREIAMQIEKFCTLRQGIDLKNNDLIYQITTGSLEGSYDSRVSIRVDKDIEYYVTVECSIHKIVLGHNVYGGTDDIQSAVNYLHNLLQNIMSIKFPFCFKKWKVYKLDNAEIYELADFSVITEWFKGLNTCDYPRRKVRRYGLESICAYGSTTSLKLYHKGPEFWKHDRKRLQDLGYMVNELQELANKILRVEVSIRGRKLKAMYGGRYPYVGEVNMRDIMNVYDVEVMRFLKEGVSDMTMVRNTHDVRDRLFQKYSPELAARLLGTWYQLTTLGEDSVKKNMNRQTYWRHTKQLKDAGVSWHGTDVVLATNSIVPSDFVPVRTDVRRVSGECEEMQNKLLPYRKKVA